ncbi:sigma-54 dependent transcriptional regulator [Aquabacterium sp.]|uniref:sigma-54-dependent transcriptional regulator n=1 Tax=Aquabacterium sp. TaxID=1872578 RepID=UPI002E374B4F|nr:sigma-54 dependent transcriptional regulator [Aquabacterium sp.]HEX5313263.1 sigma-54 dependent transcriptional regulator [Aquabacterium sp.]
MTSPASHRLLVVDDEPDLRTLYELTLLREGYAVDTAGSIDDAWQHLQQQSYSAVITDMRLPDGNGLDLIQRLDAARRPERAIVITAYGSAENAVTALKAGAYDYLTKPVDLKQFRSVVLSAVGGAERPGSTAPSAAPEAKPESGALTARGVPPLMSHSLALTRLTGHSPAIEQVRSLIEKVSRSMAPVLLWGESGTGKELVARAIHDVSARSKGPFIAVNCGAIPEHLLEAEFFGYRKGAFTGASEDRDGFFQAARGGTLFLDEIGDLPLSMQSKLLRAIQERAVRAVGTTAEVPVDVRIVSATHKDLAAAVQQGTFRQDLYYRLNVIQIALPPLRERLTDLPALSQRLLEKIAKESHLETTPTLSPAALQALAQYAFPGNIRELENLLQRAVALSNQSLIEPDDLGLSPTKLPEPAESTAAAPFPIAPPLTTTSHDPIEAALPPDLAGHLDTIERDILVRALEKHRLNRTAAGSSLGLTLRQMRYRMARLGIQITDQGLKLGERFDPDQDTE